MDLNNDSVRRMIMMVVIIVVGTIVTFVDMPPILVVVVTLTAGIVLLFTLKMVTVAEIKSGFSDLRQSLNKPISLKRGNKGEETEGAHEKEKSDTKKSGLGSKFSLGEKFSGIMEKLNKPISLKKGDAGKDAKGKEAKGADSKDKAGKDGGDGGKFGFIKNIFSKNKKVQLEKNQQIDSMLDRVVKGKFPDDTETTGAIDIRESEKEDKADGGAGAVGAGSATEKTSLSTEDFEINDFDDMKLDLGDEAEEEEDDLSDISLDGVEDDDGTEKSKSVGFEEEIPDSAIADILAKEGIELELEDESFPSVDGAAGGEGSGSSSSGGALSSEGIGDIDDLDSDVSGLDLDGDDMGDIEEIDLDELDSEEVDLGDEGEVEDVELGDQETHIPEPAVAPAPDNNDELFAPPKEWSQTSTVDMTQKDNNGLDSQITFGLDGGGDEDDLFAMLKSDTKKAVTVQEVSLVRDLKDTVVNSEELVVDLERILGDFGVSVEEQQEAVISNDNGPDNSNNHENMPEA